MSVGSSIAGGGAASGAGGGIGGALGATDNRIPRSDGAGGSTLQAGLTTEDDAGNVTTTGNLTPGKRLLGRQGANVASVSIMTLGDGNYFIVTGTTTINGISESGWTVGSVIVLEFSDSLTVTHDAAVDSPFLLVGSANLAATAGDTLTLMLDSISAWRELARAVI